MIGNVPFYHSLFKKYVIVFGTLFNNINIERYDASGVLQQTLKVPIAYGPREKFLARVADNPSAIALTAIKLPRMAFEVTGMTYAPNRKLNTMNTVATRNNINGVNVYNKTYTPVPYDVSFKLNVMTKTMEDGLRIAEQILPYFTPEWTVSAKLVPGFDNITDIPVVLTNVQLDDEYEADFTTRRVLMFSFDFVMKCYFYGPVSENKLIKFVDIKMYPDIVANTTVVETTVRPGLTANGMPTSNAAISVPYTQIEETDTYGFIVTTTETYGG